jgi:hypothetical protein
VIRKPTILSTSFTRESSNTSRAQAGKATQLERIISLFTTSDFSTQKRESLHNKRLVVEAELLLDLLLPSLDTLHQHP